MKPLALFPQTSPTSPQQPSDLHFIGGRPALPPEAELPRCALCGEQLTFFWQVALPTAHPWAGKAIALFACVSTPHDEHLAPRLPGDRPKGVVVTADFMKAQQSNFRTLVFDVHAAVPRMDYEPRVRFLRLSERGERGARAVLRIADRPKWTHEDETPGMAESGEPFCFLVQLSGESVFPTLPTAPPQAQPSFIPSKLIAMLDPVPEYKLFVGNDVFFFGTSVGSSPSVYAVAQKP
jgi:hypothetical protein